MAKLEGDLSSEDFSKWWDTSEITIFNNWEKYDLDEVMAWQYNINKRFSPGDSAVHSIVISRLASFCQPPLF